MTTASTTPVVDWKGWLDRWEAQQGAYMPDREERFSVMIGALAALCGETPHIVDLGSGPGSLARRVLDRLPGARVTAIDMDPVLLAIGRNALGDQGGRLNWLDADLRSRWRPADAEQVDGAVSTTALHWLQPDALAALYRHLGTVLQPGGVFINGDRLGFPPESPRIAAAVDDMRDQRDQAAPPPGAESWEEWWAAVKQEPGLADQLAERERRHHDHPDHDHPVDVTAHAQALREAGFSEVETIWQKLADRVLVAVR
ncbi:MAG: class I SAM-dependent methyltransferase [Candidatus Dormibacteria bacterium]|jgi:SAM-dependent methyltransferase